MINEYRQTLIFRTSGDRVKVWILEATNDSAKKATKDYFCVAYTCNVDKSLGMLVKLVLSPVG